MKAVHFSSRALGILASAAMTSLAVAADSSVIARVGDTEIKIDEIQPYFAKISPQDREALSKNPAALNQVVRKLIVNQLLYKEALATGWEKRPEVVAQLEQLKQAAIAESYLQSAAKIPDGYPSASEVEAAYNAKKETLILPRQINLSQIYIAKPAETDKAALAKATARVDALSKSLKQPNADFATLAQSVANDPETEGKGGEVGWVAETELQPEVRSHVASLPKGGVTEVLKMPDGWYVLKVTDIRESRPATLDEVKDQLVQALRTERARLNREAFLARLQQQNPVSINELDLAQVIGSKN